MDVQTRICPTNLKRVIRLSVPLLLLLLTADACFIRTCPLGGKRSSDEVFANTWSKAHSCMRCGPHNQGRCVSPRICCGPAIGCLFNTKETEICMAENNNPIPCQVQGPICGSEGGHCVAEGVCCTDGACTLDSGCTVQIADDEHGLDYKDDSRITALNVDAIEDLMKNLLRRKSFGSK